MAIFPLAPDQIIAQMCSNGVRGVRQKDLNSSGSSKNDVIISISMTLSQAASEQGKSN